MTWRCCVAGLLLVACTATLPAAAPPPALATEWALVPADAKVIVSVRPNKLAAGMGTKADKLRLPYLAGWKKHIGVPLREVERFTVVAEQNGRLRFLIVQTRRKIRQEEILKAC